METKIIKELGIEITKPKKYIGSYKDIKIPKGWRLPEIWEMFRLHEIEEHCDFIFLKNTWQIFPCKQLKSDIKNNWSRWVYCNWGDGLVARNDDLLDASSCGRVFFVRELKEIEDKRLDKEKVREVITAYLCNYMCRHNDKINKARIGILKELGLKQ